MDFVGKICPYCKTEFKEGDDIVVCSVCEMPHHKECWIENKACTTFGCTGTIVGADQYAEAVDNKKFCSKCGTPLNADQKFCTSCGTPADATGEPHFQVAGGYGSNQPYQQNVNPAPQYTPQPQYTQPQPQYVPPQQQYVQPQPQFTQPQPQYTPPQPQYNPQYNANGFNQQVDQDMYTFLGSKQAYYIPAFKKMQMNNSKTSWNWCSFLFGAYWYAYRKMYGIAAGYAVGGFIIGFIPGIGALLALALSLCSGLFGNYFYNQYAASEVQASKVMDPMSKNAHLAKKGGTNAGAAWAVFGAMFVLGLIVGSM